MPSPLQMTRTSPTRQLDAQLFDRFIHSMRRGNLNPSTCVLHKRLAEQMLERRTFVKRESPVVLEVGAHSGWFLRHMIEKQRFFGCKQYIQCDVSEDALNNIYRDVKDKLPPGMEFVQICCDEEEPGALEIPARSVDMAVSCLNLHWVNELEPAMINIRTALKKDAFLLAAVLGGNTLYELRSSFTLADMEVRGGVSPHVSPMLDGAGVSELTMQSGFALPNVDMDRYVLTYDSPFHLMEHVQSMGESACHVQRSPYLPRKSLTAMAAIYQRLYGKENGLVPATFEVFHMICWSPSPDQPQPLERGSAQISLKQVTTSVHRQFQDALAESAKKPDDVELQAKAEKLYEQLQQAMADEADAGPAPTDLDKVMGVTPKKPAPAPPERFRPEVVPPKRRPRG